MSLATQDLLLTILHLLIIGFNLLGWALPKLRLVHFWFTMLTLFCWLILGIWYGIGYCPITDWQWNVKTQLGKIDLPGSFIKYFADRVFQTAFNPNLIDILTLFFFLIAIALSVWLNFFKRQKSPKGLSSNLNLKN